MENLILPLDLCSPTTFFQKANYNTWKQSTIDHLLLPREDQKRIKDCSITTKHGAPSDHTAIHTVVKVIARIPKKRKNLHPSSLPLSKSESETFEAEDQRTRMDLWSEDPKHQLEYNNEFKRISQSTKKREALKLPDLIKIIKASRKVPPPL